MANFWQEYTEKVLKETCAIQILDQKLYANEKI